MLSLCAVRGGGAFLIWKGRSAVTEDKVDLTRAERAMREFLTAVGVDLAAQGMEETPARVAQLYADLFSGLHTDTRDLWADVLTEETDGLIAVRSISFHSVCEHHLLPFFGTAHIVYRPHAGRVAGFGIFTRLVERMARRPQLQERLTGDIARAIEQGLGAEGVLVVLDARQLCMTMRGARAHGTRTTTSACRGLFREDKTMELQAWKMIGEWDDGRENVSLS